MGLEDGGNRSRDERDRLGRKMRKTVYLIDQPLDERNYERFGVRVWLERRWAVEVWDLTSWAHPAVWQDFIQSGQKTKEFVGYFAVRSRKDLARRLAAAGPISYFVDLTSEIYQSIQAKISLQRAGAVRIVCAVGSMPAPDRAEIGIVDKLAQVLAKGPRGASKWLSSAFLQRVVVPHVATGMAVVSGEKSIAGLRNCRQIIRAHNFDYDIYLALQKSTRSTPGRFVVFIDQDYCFHPEYLYQSVRALVSPDKYFPAVSKGMKLISEALQMDARIAAHPRATYQQRSPDYFGGFPIEYGRTAELIRDCYAVVCHDSTAIQFAVLFEKPMIFVTTRELMSSYEGRSIAKVASELGKSPIDLDRPDLEAVDWQKELRVDSRKYAQYKRRYIKTEASPETPLWDIVLDHIEIGDRQAA
jgi:hypothetical protein